jgi:hypothetical protein
MTLSCNVEMKNAMKKFAPVLSLVLLFQGCVGAGVMKSRTATAQNPKIPSYADASAFQAYQRGMSGMPNTTVFTSAWLESHWGKPVSIIRPEDSASDEIWTYRFRPIWEGIVPVVIVPMPVSLPLGRERVRYVLRDGQVISATYTTRQTVGGAVGISVGPCNTVAGAFSLKGLFQ